MAGLAIAAVLGALGGAYSDPGPASALVFIVLIAPFVIGCSVPVNRHGRVAAAGVATGWLVVCAAVLLVGLTTTDDALAEGLGYAFLGWLLVLLIEAIAVGTALRLRRIASPPPPIRVPDIRELDAKFRSPDSRE